MSITNVLTFQCDKMAVSDMSCRKRAVIEFENNLAAGISGRFRYVHGDAFVGANILKRWVNLTTGI